MIGQLDPTILAIAIGVMSGIFLLLVAAALPRGSSRRYARRFQAVSTRRQLSSLSDDATPMRLMARRESTTPGIDRFFHMLPRREALIERLSRTGYEISVGQYMLGSIAIIFVVTVLVMVFAHLGPALSLMIGIAVGLAVPHYIVGKMGKRRVFRFINLFPEAIDLMVRALRAGLPISEAIINAGQEIGDPVGTELHGIEAGMRLGRDLESLLWEIAKRITAPEFRFFIIALSVQRETGGNLAETLNNLSEVLRRRRTMRAKARAMASEARASTMILGSLPFLVTAVLSVTSPGYIAPMFSDIRGLMLLGFALIMLTTGISIMVKMARFEI